MDGKENERKEGGRRRSSSSTKCTRGSALLRASLPRVERKYHLQALQYELKDLGPSKEGKRARMEAERPIAFAFSELTSSFVSLPPPPSHRLATIQLKIYSGWTHS